MGPGVRLCAGWKLLTVCGLVLVPVVPVVLVVVCPPAHGSQDCVRRGAAYTYQYPLRDGEPGACLKRGEKVQQRAAAPTWGAMDYLKMDLRNMCKARKWVWRNGRCGPKALRVGSSDADADKFEKMAGTVSQHGWHGPSRPKPLAPDKPVEGFPRKQTVAPGFFLF